MDVNARHIYTVTSSAAVKMMMPTTIRNVPPSTSTTPALPPPNRSLSARGHVCAHRAAANGRLPAVYNELLEGATTDAVTSTSNILAFWPSPTHRERLQRPPFLLRLLVAIFRMLPFAVRSQIGNPLPIPTARFGPMDSPRHCPPRKHQKSDKNTRISRHRLETILGIGIRPSRLATYQQALTHPSAVADRTESFERLELLGDGVLTLVARELLLERLPLANEGMVTIQTSALVSSVFMSQHTLSLRSEEERRAERGGGTSSLTLSTRPHSGTSASRASPSGSASAATSGDTVSKVSSIAVVVALLRCPSLGTWHCSRPSASFSQTLRRSDAQTLTSSSPSSSRQFPRGAVRHL